MPDLRVVVDGIVLAAGHPGGVYRMFHTILPLMCNMEPALEVDLLLEKHALLPPPDHPRISQTRLPSYDRWLRPYRIWKPVLNQARRTFRSVAIGMTVGCGDKSRIWHSTYYSMPPYWRGSQVVSVYDMIHELFADGLLDTSEDVQFRKLKRRCVEHSDCVISISETTKQDICRLYKLPETRVVVIPLAANPEFRPLHNRQRCSLHSLEGPFLLYVGGRIGYNGYKNFQFFLEAYASWNNRKNVSLVVAGSKWSETEKHTIRALQLDREVQPARCPDDEELCQLYNRASAFIYPSLYEGFGIPLVEAMACGCPIVASRIPSSVEVAGDVPAYFDPRAKDELHAALDLVLSEGRDSPRTKRGLTRAASFSWERTARETVAIYKALS